jgi:ribosomal protein S21
MSTINLEVKLLDKNDTGEKLIKRFLKKFKKFKLMDEFRKHEYFVSPSEERRERERGLPQR